MILDEQVVHINQFELALSNTEQNFFIYPSSLEKNSSHVSGVSVCIFVALWLGLYGCVLQGPIRLKVP